MGKAQEIAAKAVSNRWVVYEGTCDVLPLVPADWKVNPATGKVMETIPGLELRFNGGYTRPFDMEYGPDAEFVAQVDQYLAEHGEKDSRIMQFNVHRSEADAVRRPFNNFDKLTAKKIRELVLMLLPEDMHQQVGFIENCIKYEAQNQNRKTVISALGDLLDSEPDDDDLVEVEVDV